LALGISQYLIVKVELTTPVQTAKFAELQRSIWSIWSIHTDYFSFLINDHFSVLPFLLIVPNVKRMGNNYSCDISPKFSTAQLSGFLALAEFERTSCFSSLSS